MANKTSFKKGQKFFLNGKRMGREKGCIPWNKGIKQWKEKIHPTRGKKMSNISEIKKEWWKNWRKTHHTTRLSTCLKCKKEFSHIKHKSRKYCSKSCSTLSRDPKVIKRTALKTAQINRLNGNYDKARTRMLNGGAIKARVAARLARPSKPQLELYKRVKEYFPTAELEYSLKTKNTTRFLDIAMPDRKFCIEYDGKYWHQNRELEDSIREEEIRDCGWEIIKVTEEM